MEHGVRYSTSLASRAEDLFLELFCDAFGPEKTQYLSIQHPFVDIYGNRRYIDFALESDELRIAIEIDGERYHNPCCCIGKATSICKALRVLMLL